MKTENETATCVHCEEHEDVQNLFSFEKKLSAGGTTTVASALEHILGVKLSLTPDNRRQMKLCVYCFEYLRTCYQVRDDFMKRGMPTGFVSQLMNQEGLVGQSSRTAGPSVGKTPVYHDTKEGDQYRRKFKLRNCYVALNKLPDYVTSNVQSLMLRSNPQLPPPSKRVRCDVDDLGQVDMWSNDCDWNDSPPSPSAYLDMKFEVFENNISVEQSAETPTPGTNPVSSRRVDSTVKTISTTEDASRTQYNCGELIKSDQTFHCSEEHCNEEFPFEAMLWSHEVLNHRDRVPHKSNRSGVHKCFKCDKLFLGHIGKMNIMDHMFVHSKELRFKCPVDGCDYRTWTRRGVYYHNTSVSAHAHSQQAHRPNKSSKSKVFQINCATVVHSADNDIVVEQAEERITSSDGRALREKFKCRMRDCHKTFLSNGALKNHENTVHEVSSEQENDLENSGSNSEPEDGTGSGDDDGSDDCTIEDAPRTQYNCGELIKSDKTFHCSEEDCNEEFPFEAMLWSHKVVNHRARVPHKSIRSGVYKCFKCDKLFLGHIGKMNIMDHMFVHSMEMRFKCPADGCDYRTWARRGVYSHSVSAHTHLTQAHRPNKSSKSKIFQINCATSVHSADNDIVVEQAEERITSSDGRALREKFKCRIRDCHKTFLSNGALKNHESTVHEVISEQENDLENSGSNSEPEDGTGSGDDDGSNDCTIEDAPRTQYNCGELIKSDKTFHCSEEDCNEEFPFEAVLWTHEVLNHRVRVPHKSNRSGVYKCYKCDKLFLGRTRKMDIMDHMFAHSKEMRFKCTVDGCKFKTSIRRGVYFHLQTHDSKTGGEQRKPKRRRFLEMTVSQKHTLQSLTCTNCYKTLRNPNALLKHMRKCVSFNCTFCPYSTRDAESFNAHMLSDHDGEVPLNEVENDTSAVGDNRDQDLVHTVIQSTETYTCPKESCGVAFPFRADMLAHVIVRHETPVCAEKFQCDMCSFTIETTSVYRIIDHMFVHTKELRFRCPKRNCNYKSWNRRGVPYHLAHHKHKKCYNGQDYVKPIDSTNSFECPQCTVTFGFEAKLMTHIYTEHAEKSPEGKWQCHLCSYQTVSHHLLRLHYFRHTKEHCFKCTVDDCRFSSFQREFVARHVQRDHFPESNTHMCDMCGKLVVTKSALGKHVSKVHRNYKESSKKGRNPRRRRKQENVVIVEYT